MKNILLGVVAAFILAAGVAYAGGLHAYIILANINDEKLVLMDQYRGKHVVEAKTFCLGGGWDEGDIVFSTENLDICVASKLISKSSGNTCDVWCP